MRILWCVNFVLPDAARTIGLKSSPLGGWMVSLLADLSATAGVELAVATLYGGHELKKISVNNVTYFLIPGGPRAMLKRSNEKLRGYWREIAADWRPDVNHLHGTEYSHGLALLEACPHIPAVVSIQGLVGVYERYYYAGLEFADVFLRPSLRDLIRLDPIWNGRLSFQKRAVAERDILRRTRHVIGRTTWDYANVKAINPAATYHHCDEGLRDPFYEATWDIAKATRHTIFTTQASYPIKGFHILLKAVALLKRDYPNIKVCAAGQNILGSSTFSALRMGGYALYVKRLISSLGLQNHVEFTGMIDAQGVAQQLLAAHAFVIPSAVENSPNALAEALLVGTPCIGAYVGGVPDMLEQGKCGMLYPFAEEAMLADYIRRLFTSDDLALRFSQAGRTSSHQRHNRSNIAKRMVEIYSTVR